MIATLDDDFISPDLQENIMSVDVSDGHEHDVYSIYLESGNYENDLQVVQDTQLDMDNNSQLMTGSVSIILTVNDTPDRHPFNALLSVISDRSALSTQCTHGYDQ